MFIIRSRIRLNDSHVHPSVIIVYKNKNLSKLIALSLQIINENRCYSGIICTFFPLYLPWNAVRLWYSSSSILLCSSACSIFKRRFGSDHTPNPPGCKDWLVGWLSVSINKLVVVGGGACTVSLLSDQLLQMLLGDDFLGPIGPVIINKQLTVIHKGKQNVINPIIIIITFSSKPIKYI